MNSTRVWTLFDLPSEILWEIVPLLSRNDLSVCVRVSKSWHHAFMDSLWHTVELKDADYHGLERPVFNRIESLYRPHLVLRGKEAVASKSPFLRNLHRIRVIAVQYTSFLNLFWDQGSLPLEPIPLEKLHVEFDDDPKPLLHLSDSNQPYEPPEPTDMVAILQILGRSSRLSTFSFFPGVLVHKQQLEDQARLLTSLPPSLEKMDMMKDGMYHGADMVVDKNLKTKALDLFLELNKNSFENLTTLTMAGTPVDEVLLVALVESSPRLEELSVDGYHANWDDSKLEEIISKACSKGWKTLGFNNLFSDEVGPLTVKAILENSATLENLRLPNSKAFDSRSIQKLLRSAPNLKRFDLISDFVHGELEPFSLMAMDVVESAEDWICLGLETFKCYIGGVPRPEITAKKNGRPLLGIFNDGARYFMSESSTIQRRVLAQLSRLTKLREVTLGKDVVEYDAGNHEAHWYEQELEGEYFSYDRYELGSQYQCLSMSLQDGLGELIDLKCLRRLTLEKMSLRMGEAEQAWMRENWTEYGKESRDTFWTSRGHSLTVGTDLHNEKFNTDDLALEALATYDWW